MKPQLVIGRKSVWKNPTSPHNMSTVVKDCGQEVKEVKGWPPDKVVANLRPYLYPNGKNTSLILPRIGAQWQVESIEILNSNHS